MECGLELVIGRLLLKSNLGAIQISEERESECKKLLERRHLTLSVRIDSDGRNLTIMSFTYLHSKLVVFALENAISPEARRVQSDEFGESHADVIVLFKFCEIALKSLNKMPKLLIPCFKISDL